MNFLKFFFIIFFIFIFLANCTKQEKVSVIEDKDVELQMIDAFKETAGFDLLGELDCTYNSPASDIADSYFICKFQSENPLK